MILGPDSPLKRLPMKMNPRQSMFFDAIRFAIEMTDFAMERLYGNLVRLVASDSASGSPVPLAVEPFLDAWSIVDGIHRLGGLLGKMPGFKKKHQSPDFRRFSVFADKAKDLRNAVQHMNNEEIQNKSAAPIASPI